jgi:hypothetical protein
LVVVHVGFHFFIFISFLSESTPRPPHFHVIFAHPKPAHSTPNPAQSTGISTKEKF